MLKEQPGAGGLEHSEQGESFKKQHQGGSQVWEMMRPILNEFY